MNDFIGNLFDVTPQALKVLALMVAAGVFLLQQTTEKTALSLLFAPVMLVCALAVRSLALPIGIALGMDEGVYLVLTTTVGMCISLGLFAAYSRATGSMT